MIFKTNIENSSNNCETLECDLCEIEDFSEIRLKIHKAKWHTNVAPMYGNITRQLAQIEKNDRECLIC